MNPIIFLDFDGVLNSQLYYKRLKDEELVGTHTDLDPEAVQKLNTLCTEAKAKVVITATARLNRSIEELEEMLEKTGFTGEILGKTEDLRNGKGSDSILRGNEVLHWIKGHPAEIGAPYWNYHQYVILDDDSDFLYWQRNNMVITDPYVGITRKTVFLAKRILGLNINTNELAAY